MKFLRKAAAFLKRNFISEKNYRLIFFMHIFNIVSIIALFYFMTRIINQQQNNLLVRYKGDFFIFLLIGLAYTRFLYTWLNCFADSLQGEFYNGSLEIMLVTPTSIFEILFFSVLWSQVYAFMHVLLYFFAGAYFFKVHFAPGGYILALIIALVSMPIFMGLGIIYAALLISFKKSGSVRGIIIFAFTFFGGVYFPIELLPPKLQIISYFVPVTYSLRAMREVLINGRTFSFISGDLFILGVSSAILFLLSILIFKWSFIRARASGGLMHY